MSSECLQERRQSKSTRAPGGAIWLWEGTQNETRAKTRRTEGFPSGDETGTQIPAVTQLSLGL